MSEKIILLKNWDQTLIIFRSADNNSGFKKITYSLTLHRQTERQTEIQTDRYTMDVSGYAYVHKNMLKSICLFLN